MKAIFGKVVNVKPVRSRSVAIVEIELPDEHFPASVDFYDKDVLVTLAPDEVRQQWAYGVVDSENKGPCPPSGIGVGTGNQEQGGAPCYIAQLHRRGITNDPRLWEALERGGVYTANAHKAWLEQEPCQMAKTIHGPCDGEIVVHHVRNAANAGTGIKPAHWFGVPLCHKHHSVDVHDHGTAELREFLFSRVAALRKTGIHEALRAHFDVESMASVSEEAIDEFFAEIGYMGPGAA